jgi:hypothetical protein
MALILTHLATTRVVHCFFLELHCKHSWLFASFYSPGAFCIALLPAGALGVGIHEAKLTNWQLDRKRGEVGIRPICVQILHWYLLAV